MVAQIQIEDLFLFFQELRGRGFKIGTEQFIATQNILLNYAARGLLPGSEIELRQMLGPIVCSSPQDQTQFAEYFSIWYNSNSPLKKPGFRKFVSARLRTAYRGINGWIILCASLCIALAGYYFLSRVDTFSIFGKVVSEKEGKPIEGALISFAGIEKRSGPEGKFSMQVRRGTEGMFIVSHPDFVTEEDNVNRITRESSVEIFLRKIKKEPNELDSGQRSRESTRKRIKFSFQEKRPHRISINVDPFYVFSTVFPLILFIGWVVVKFVFGRHYLMRNFSYSAGTHNFVQIPEYDITGNRANWRRIGAQLRRPKVTDRQLLHIATTVEATVRNAGLFSPAYRATEVRPDFVALIDRRNYRDHGFHLIKSLLQPLTDINIPVRLFYFDGDPNNLQDPEARSRPHLDLRELASRFSASRLMIFSDAKVLFNFKTGQAHSWVHQIQRWENRTLFTTVDIENWGGHEHRLVRWGIHVLPSNSFGLAAYARIQETGDEKNVRIQSHSGPFPSLLRSYPERWLEGPEPEVFEASRLVNQLEKYLGPEGFYWLCATAVYPETNWGVTVYLGRSLQLAGNTEIYSETTLVSFANLPWFRYGKYPVWLRRRLLSRLTKRQDSEIRSSLRSLFEENSGAGSNFTLRWMIERQGFLPALKRRIQYLFSSAPDEMTDDIFVSFMTKSRIDQLVLKLPNRWRHRFYLRRNLVSVTLAFILSLALSITIANTVVNTAKKAGINPDPQDQRVFPTPLDENPRLPGFPSSGNPINPQTGQPYPDKLMKQFEELKKRFPENEIIPRTLSPDERAILSAIQRKHKQLGVKIAAGEAKRQEINTFFDREEKKIRDRLEILEYIMEKQEGKMTPDIKKQYQRILERNELQLQKNRENRLKALENN